VVERLTNGIVLDDDRPGSILGCPSCASSVNYTILNISAGVDVYLYCDSCSNFTLRNEDRVMEAGADQEAALEARYLHLEVDLPRCGCGGRFKTWSNVKCGGCGFEFPYNGGIHDIHMRAHEPKIVWTKGSIAYRGASLPSNRLTGVSHVGNDR
jgi:hypothetical protein